MTSLLNHSADSPLVGAAERSLEAILAPYSVSCGQRQSRLSEAQVRQISEALSRTGRESWSKIPRIYAVLYMVKSVHTIESFISKGVTDLWFPFSHKTLPEGLRSPSARFEFLEFQDLVLTKALDLEREDGGHRHFARSDDIPLQKLEELGKGGFGYVDRVLSTLTYREYARKLIPRGKTFKKNVEVLKDFERELGHLKKLRHLHIVELIGSYTEPRFVGILMAPVADCNLKDFLARDPLSQGDKSFLRTFYGCLASALNYLHQNLIRHKDIKPQNVLVKGHQVFLTDFGISLDWSDLGQSTTTGVAVKTPRYCAPEVAQCMPRNSSSDMWSLGCVFVEIWTILKGRTVSALYDYLADEGSKSTCYYLNLSSVYTWCNSLEALVATTDENPPLEWISGALKLDIEERWTAQQLVDRITETNDNPEHRYAFSGMCCVESDESIGSYISSKRSSRHLDETGVSSIGAYVPKLIELEQRGITNDITGAHSPCLQQAHELIGEDCVIRSEAEDSKKDNDDSNNPASGYATYLDTVTSERDNGAVSPERLRQLSILSQSSIYESEQDTRNPTHAQRSANDSDGEDETMRKWNQHGKDRIHGSAKSKMSEVLSRRDSIGKITRERDSVKSQDDLSTSLTVRPSIETGLIKTEFVPPIQDQSQLAAQDVLEVGKLARQDQQSPLVQVSEAPLSAVVNDHAIVSKSTIRSEKSSTPVSRHGVDSLFSPSAQAENSSLVAGEDTRQSQRSLASQSSRSESSTSLSRDAGAITPLGNAQLDLSLEALRSDESVAHDLCETSGFKQQAFPGIGGREQEMTLRGHPAIQPRTPKTVNADLVHRLVRPINSGKTSEATNNSGNNSQMSKDHSKAATMFSEDGKQPATDTTQLRIPQIIIAEHRDRERARAKQVTVRERTQETDTDIRQSKDDDGHGYITDPHLPIADATHSKSTFTPVIKNQTGQSHDLNSSPRASSLIPIKQVAVGIHRTFPQAQILNEDACSQLKVTSANMIDTIDEETRKLLSPESISMQTSDLTNHVANFFRHRPSCNKCHKPIRDSFVKARGETYHMGCIVCYDCGEVSRKLFSVHEQFEDRQVCEKDYFRRLDRLCHDCSQPLRSGYVTTCGRKYHPEHFRCITCKVVLKVADNVYEAGGAVFCYYHYSLEVVPRCIGCGVATLIQIVRPPNHGSPEHWHIACFMISNFWRVDVRLLCRWLVHGKHPNSDRAVAFPSNDERRAHRDYEAEIKNQTHQIWGSLFTYDTVIARHINNAVLAISDGDPSAMLGAVSIVIGKISVLFNALQHIHTTLLMKQVEGLKFLSLTKRLCDNLGTFINMLTENYVKFRLQPRWMTEPSLVVIRTIASKMLELIYVCLLGSVRLQEREPMDETVRIVLQSLEREGIKNQLPLWTTKQRLKQLADPASDRCTGCHYTIRDTSQSTCFQNGGQRWHGDCLPCLECSVEHGQNTSTGPKWVETSPGSGRMVCYRERHPLPPRYWVVFVLEQDCFTLMVQFARSVELFGCEVGPVGPAEPSFDLECHAGELPLRSPLGDLADMTLEQMNK